MKKVITGIVFIFAVGFAQAQTDSAKTDGGVKYEYYPDVNVYYNDEAKTYWYYDSASSKWQSGAELPSGYSINANTRKNSFYYNGGNVWEKNADHLKMYGKKNKPKN